MNANEGLTARAVSNSNDPYQSYGGPRVASFTPDQTAAFDATRANVGSYKPGLAAAGTLTGQASTAFPGIDLSAYMSPYQQGVIDVAKREAVRSDDVARQSRDARAIDAGAFGGNRRHIVEAEAERNLGQNLSDIQMTGSQAAFNQAAGQFNADRQAQLGAGAQFARLGELESGLGLKDAAGLSAIGGEQQGLNQRSLDTAYGDFLEQRGNPQSQLAFLSSILRGNDVSRLFPSTQTTQLPSGSVTGQVAGLGTAGLGLYGMGKGLGFFAKGGRVQRRGLGNYAYGGQVRRFADGGLASLSTPQLIWMESQLRRSKDPRASTLSEEIIRRRNVVGGAPGAGRKTLADLVGSARSGNPATTDELGFTPEMSSVLPPKAPADPDLEGMRGSATRAPISDTATLPIPKPRPAGLAAAAPAAPEAMAFTGDDNRDTLLAENSSPFGGGAGTGDDMRENRLAENSSPYHPPAAAKSIDSSGWEAIAAAGFKAAEAASKPGATFAGALGAGGSEGIKTMQNSRREGRETRSLDIQENRAKALEDISRKELQLKEFEAKDPDSPKVQRLKQEIAESRAKLETIYPAQAEYYRGLAKRAGEKDDEILPGSFMEGEDGNAVAITRRGELKKLGIPYKKLKPQMSELDVRTAALKMVSEYEEKNGALPAPERAAKLRQFENYLLKGSDKAADPLGIR